LDTDARTIQQQLVESVRPGDPVSLEHVGTVDYGKGDRPVYVIQHAGGPIGVTGPPLGDAFGIGYRSA
jgi:hypothetical protein